MSKKLLLLFFTLTMIFAYSCSNKNEAKTSDNISIPQQEELDVNINLSEELNDLLYRNYSTGVKMSANETMRIILPTYLKSKEGNTEIIIVNILAENVEGTLKCYEENSVSYTVEKDGIYIVYAISVGISGNTEITDLTNKISFEKSYDLSGSNYVY